MSFTGATRGSTASAPSRTGMADAVLREVAELLARLLDTGDSGTIGLRGLPLTAADCEELEQRLGRGEVSATLSAAGESEIWETAFAGVWWVRHRAGDGRIALDEIAVTRMPEILMTPIDDARAAHDRLKDALAAASPVEDRGSPSARRSDSGGDAP